MTEIAERNSEDVRELTAAVFGLQRQLTHIGWGLAFALIGGLAALIVAAAL